MQVILPPPFFYKLDTSSFEEAAVYGEVEAF